LSILSTVERYDPDLDEWQLMDPLPEPRWAAAAALAGDVLLLNAGLEDEQTYHSTSLMLSFKNVAPVAVASVASTGLLGAQGSLTAVRISAAGSSDADVGDTLTYEWSDGSSTLAVTADPVVEALIGLPVGTHTLTLTATDRFGATDQATLEVTIVEAAAGLQAQLDVCVDEQSQLEEDLDAAHDEVDSLEAQLLAAQGALAAANAVNDSLQASLDAADDEKAALQSQILATQSALAAANATNDALQAQLLVAQSALAAANTANDSLQADLDAANAAKAVLQAQLVASLAEVDIAQAERDQCLLDADALMAQISALEALVDELSGGQATAGQVVDRLQALLRAAIPDPDFVVPGATSADKLERLLAAIEKLPRGALQNLYNALTRRAPRP